MNDLLIESQKIAEKIEKQIPKPAYKAAYLACRNQCLPQMEINVATQQYKECCTQIANAIELSYDIGVVIVSIAEQIQEMIKSMVLNIQYVVQSMPMLNLKFVNSHKKLYDRLLFYRIAEEIGFPIYLECGTDLQDQLIESYRENNNNCNVDEMRNIIMLLLSQNIKIERCILILGINIEPDDLADLRKSINRLDVYCAASSG